MSLNFMQYFIWLVAFFVFLLLDAWFFMLIGKKIHTAYLTYTKSLKVVVYNLLLCIPPTIAITTAITSPEILAVFYIIISILSYILLLKIYFNASKTKSITAYLLHLPCQILIASLIAQLTFLYA